MIIKVRAKKKMKFNREFIVASEKESEQVTNTAQDRGKRRKGKKRKARID